MTNYHSMLMVISVNSSVACCFSDSFFLNLTVNHIFQQSTEIKKIFTTAMIIKKPTQKERPALNRSGFSRWNSKIGLFHEENAVWGLLDATPMFYDMSRKLCSQDLLSAGHIHNFLLRCAYTFLIRWPSILDLQRSGKHYFYFLSNLLKDPWK